MYRLPYCLFQCEQLNRLELFQCALSLPAAFQGFRDLVTIDFQDTIFTADDLERLVCSCPLLKNLELQYNPGCDGIRISAPNLKKLTLIGSFRCLHLKNTPVLAIVSIDLTSAVSPGDRHEAGSGCGLIELFSALACVEKLGLEKHFLGVLTAGDVPEQLPASLDLLRSITMDVDLGDLKECKAALCLLRSCPSLEVLKIRHRSSESSAADAITDYWEAKASLDCKFNRLTTMEMPDIVGARPEMAFAGFMLASAPKLVLFNVWLGKKVLEDTLKYRLVTKSLLSFPRASIRARIILVD